MRVEGRRYDTGGLVALELADGRIARVETLDSSARRPGLPWLAPGFVDIQVNGLLGQEFASLNLTVERAAHILREFGSHGVTRLCPTLTTQSFEVLRHGMQTVAATCEAFPDVAARVCGIHLEGPCIAPEDGPRGAHPREHVRPPNWDEFQQLQAASGQRIKLVTLAAEYPESPDFIARATSSGVTVALGHTAANSAQIRAAVEAGARLSTHLGNGAHRELRRHPNYVWDQMAEDRLMASLIVDGHHLPAEVVKSLVRAKTPGRCLLVSDVSGLAGLPPGEYPSMGGSIEILPDGRLVLAGQRQLLAGASLPIGTGIALVIKFAGVDLKTAVEMATLHPCRALNLPEVGLRPGDPADLVLFDWKPDPTVPPALRIAATLLRGELVYGYAESLTAD